MFCDCDSVNERWTRYLREHLFPAPVRPLIDAALVAVQAALEPAAFAEAFAAGQQMALAEAFLLMLENVHGS